MAIAIGHFKWWLFVGVIRCVYTEYIMIIGEGVDL